MKTEEILNSITESNKELFPYHYRYFNLMLENNQNEYWEEDRVETAKFIYLSYYHEEYELHFRYLDSEIDEVYQKESFSFTDFLANEDPELAARFEGFIPKVLFEDNLSELQDLTMEIDESMAAHFKLVFDEVAKTQTHLPVVFKEEDAARFIDIATGDTYDYVELKTYIFGKLSEEELLIMMQDKLDIAQSYFSGFVSFILKNEDGFTWSDENVKQAKGVLITIAYDCGSIHLEYLNNKAEKIEKLNDLRYMKYLEEKENFAYRFISIYFPFEIYDYILNDSEFGIEPFKNKINEWLINGLNKSEFINKDTPWYIQEVFEDDYLDIQNNTIIDLKTLLEKLNG